MNDCLTYCLTYLNLVLMTHETAGQSQPTNATIILFWFKKLSNK